MNQLGYDNVPVKSVWIFSQICWPKGKIKTCGTLFPTGEERDRFVIQQSTSSRVLFDPAGKVQVQKFGGSGRCGSWETGTGKFENFNS